MELILAQAIPSERSGMALADRPARGKPRAPRRAIPRDGLATARLERDVPRNPAFTHAKDARVVIVDGMGATRRANRTWHSGSTGSARCQRPLLSRSRRPQIVPHAQRLPHRRVDH